MPPHRTSPDRFIRLRNILIKSVRGAAFDLSFGLSLSKTERHVQDRSVEPRWIAGNLWYFPFTPFGWLRTGFDKLRVNGRLDQRFLN